MVSPSLPYNVRQPCCRAWPIANLIDYHSEMPRLTLYVTISGATIQTDQLILTRADRSHRTAIN